MGTDNASNSKHDQAAATMPGSASAAPSPLRVQHIFGVLVQVRDLERSLSFYRDVLGLSVEQNDGVVALLRGSGEGVRALTLRQIGPRATHYLGGTGVARVAWEVRSSADLDLAEQLLQRHGVQYDRPSGEKVDSIVTSDPDGLSVVVLAADTLGASPPARLFARE
jgi:catechol 2,3-dioxygenase-like lactoylglutathione lyase family enzyme